MMTTVSASVGLPLSNRLSRTVVASLIPAGFWKVGFLLPLVDEEVEMNWGWLIDLLSHSYCTDELGRRQDLNPSPGVATSVSAD